VTQKGKKKLIYIGTTLLALISLLAINITPVLHFMLVSMASTELTSLSENTAKFSKKIKWFDDYYTVQYLDESTIAIGEPRYWQQNINYLIIGEKQALLFDSGPGHRNIRPVVESLTDLPVIVMASHYHYDHVGNMTKFENQYLSSLQVDISEVKSKYPFIPKDNRFITEMAEKEGLDAPALNPVKIVKEYESIDLGGRAVEVLFTPGHSTDSIMVFDKERNQLFSGDFVFAFISAAKGLISSESQQDYIESTEMLLTKINDGTGIYSAHYGNPNAVAFSYEDIRDMNSFFKQNEGGFFPKFDKINDRIEAVY